MAFFENCVERATALAATCGWLTLGGGAEAAVGVAVGGAGLAAVVSDATRSHGPESKAALKAIRKKIRKDLAAFAKAENWDNRADLAAADLAMDHALAGCFLDRKALAESARSSEGFPGAATKLILNKLAEREPLMFGPDGPSSARDYARSVIWTALEAAIDNVEYFRNIHPHLLMETLRSLGSVEEKIDSIQANVSQILEVLKSNSDPNVHLEEGMKAEFYVNDRGESLLYHSKRFSKPVKRLDFELDESILYFVDNENNKRNFRMPIHHKLAKNLRKNDGQTLMILINEKTGERIEGQFVPLRAMKVV